VILACHNRREATVKALASLFAQEAAGVEMSAVVVDDGSSDGTTEAIALQWPEVVVVGADGSLYWAGAMAVAERRARCDDPDFLLWLNDDVALEPRALDVLLATYDRLPAPSIVVGALRDPDPLGGGLTYSGLRRAGWHPVRYQLVHPRGDWQSVDTFNGNVVLVPRRIYTTLSGIDGHYAHAQADLDYGLRASSAGFAVVLAPGTVGTCARGGQDGTWRDQSLSARERWRLALSRKGIPPRTQARFLRRHGGRLWLLWWISPYLKLAFSCLTSPFGAGALRAPDSKVLE